jgi:hypothetical protein
MGEEGVAELDAILHKGIALLRTTASARKRRWTALTPNSEPMRSALIASKTFAGKWARIFPRRHSRTFLRYLIDHIEVAYGKRRILDHTGRLIRVSPGKPEFAVLIEIGAP